MSRFDKGVSWYTHGTICIVVHFPEDAVCCKYCPYLRADANGARYKCQITGDILYSIDTQGAGCPIEITGGKEDGTEIPQTGGFRN